VHALGDPPGLRAVVPGPVIEAGVKRPTVEIAAVDRGDVEKNSAFESPAQRS
jgi:hypothetical protein